MESSLIGARLAHLEVTALIGSGGMGEVWKATDTRLGREVAVKVLPAEMAADPQRLERFEREARAVAALNHPNIVTIHSVERAGDLHLLTMELVAGDSLDHLLPPAGFELRNFFALAIQIADALAAAHDKGITHRDLKPANVMVSPEGRVKLLDFGLAKLAAAPSEDAETELLTGAGMVLGTTPYMSPEQAQGLVVDPRSDIFSLGILLHEMATGERPFRGANRAALTSAILTEQPPPLTTLAPRLPNHLARIVQRCLRKRPERRYQSALEVRLELVELEEELARAQSDAALPPPRPAAAATRVEPPRGWLRLLPWLVAGLALAAAAALGWLALGSPARPPVTYSRLPPPSGYSFSALDGPLALSPDGRRIAFLAAAPGEPSYLFVHSLDSLEPHRLEGTAGAKAPFWSPDGGSLAFFADAKLKRIDLPDGSPRKLADAPHPGGGSWAPDGTILFVAEYESPFRTVDEDGGEVTRLPGPYDGSVADWFFFPYFLPDGRHFLFPYQDLDGDRSGVNLASLDAPAAARQLTRTVSNVGYAAPGQLLLWEDGALVARPFDPDTFELGKGSTRIAEGVAWDRFLASGMFTVAGNGLLVYLPGAGATGDTELVQVDRQGRDISLVGPRAEYYYPRLSNDGTRVAVDITDIQTTQGDVWVLEVGSDRRTLISQQTVDESNPVWFPGDREIAFMRAPNLYRRDAAGATEERGILSSSVYKETEDLSPDGRYLLFETTVGEDRDLWLLDLETGEQRLWFGDPDTQQRNGDFSPDGKWVAYESEVAGTSQIHVRSFPSGDEKIDVSVRGGENPAWRDDGSELYYYSPDTSELVAVAVEWVDGRPSFGPPTALFSAPARDGFDVFPGGQSFLLNRKVGLTTDEPLVLVQNWQALVR